MGSGLSNMALSTDFRYDRHSNPRPSLSGHRVLVSSPDASEQRQPGRLPQAHVPVGRDVGAQLLHRRRGNHDPSFGMTFKKAL